MSKVIKKIKVMKDNGTFTEPIPIGADAANVKTEDGITVEEKIGKKTYYFNNVAEMKAYKLKNGDYVTTLGYYAANDGGGANYLIRTKTNADVQDNGSIHFVGSNLVAELLVDNEVRVEFFGAKGDGVTNDTTPITNAINYCDNIYGDSKKLYYVTSSINVSNKNLFNLNLKAEPFEVQTGNTYYKVLVLTGNNNLHNVKVESQFEYIPSIEIYADPTSTTGLASNVQAFRVESGISNFYNCKANYCWAFYLTGTGKANIYNFIGTNLEMGFFNSSSNELKVYNSKFMINKLINSIYYHHIYAIQGTDSEFNNCEFTETGSGNIGNQYHGYSTSFTDAMEVTGKLVINNCNLVTEKIMGQINGVDLFVNGGSVECSLLLAGGTLVEKPTAHLKDCNILIKAAGSEYPLSRSKVIIENCHIRCSGNGTKNISTLPYKIYNSIIDCPLGTFSNHITADENNIVSDEIVMSNCVINSKTYSWAYPYYCTNVKILNSLFNLSTLKETTNPASRGSEGFLYGCVFNNWTLPLNMDSSNPFKIDYICDGVKKSNIS